MIDNSVANIMYEIDLNAKSSSSYQKVDRKGRKIELFQKETTYFTFYVHEDEHPKNLSHVICRLRIKRPDDTTWTQKDNIEVTNPNLGMVTAKLDLEGCTQVNTPATNELTGQVDEAGIHFAQLELININNYGVPSKAYSQFFMYYVFPKIYDEGDDTPDVLSKAICDEAICDTCICDKDTINDTTRSLFSIMKDVGNEDFNGSSVLGDKFRMIKYSTPANENSFLGDKFRKLKGGK